jgi:hypothetical protein
MVKAGAPDAWLPDDGTITAEPPKPTVNKGLPLPGGT